MYQIKMLLVLLVSLLLVITFVNELLVVLVGCRCDCGFIKFLECHGLKMCVCVYVREVQVCICGANYSPLIYNVCVKNT